MNGKSLLTATLLVFIGGSLIFLIYKETRSKPVTTAAAESTVISNTTEPASEGILPATHPANMASASQDAPKHKVVAYYFHGNFRCTTCQNIEKYSREAILSGFKDVLDSGELEWRVINVEEPGNEHYSEDYKLVTKSLESTVFLIRSQSSFSSLSLQNSMPKVTHSWVSSRNLR